MIDPIASNLTFLPLQFSRNQLEHIIDPADTAILDRSGLRSYLEIMVPTFPQASTFQRLVKLPGTEKPPVTSAGSTTYEGTFFPIQELLDGFLELKKPQHGQTDLRVIVSQTMPYHLHEWIENDGVLLASTDKTGGSKWIIKAGLSEEDFVGWGAVFFDQLQTTTRRFLTWQPDVKTVSVTQEEYLYFLLNCSPLPTTVYRRVEVSYEDGSDDLLTIGSVTNAALYQVVCMPVGFTALGLGNLFKKVVQYRVWLSDQNHYRISEIRTFLPDLLHRPQERFLLFSNSLGGFDTLRLTGEGTSQLSTQRSLAQIERPASAPIDFSELKVIAIQGEREFTISTGYFERDGVAQIAYLDELLLAEEVYLITEKGHSVVELTTTSLIDQEDNPDLLARTFSFRTVSPTTSFSNLPPALEQPARPTGWRGVGVVYLLDEFGKRTGYGRPLKLQKYYLDDGSLYKPVTEKPNTQGDPDFQDKQPIVGIPPGSTPYPNVALSRSGTYSRTTCTSGEVGGPALISIAAGKYGGESEGEADSRAEAEFRLLDTQAYANANGTCTLAPEIYAWNVPAGHWHYRVNEPGRFGIMHWGAPSGLLNIGNSWDLQGQNRPYCFPQWSNDLDFPPNDSHWHAYLNGVPNGSLNLKIYQNGTLIRNDSIPLNKDGAELIILGITPVAGDKFYFRIE